MSEDIISLTGLKKSLLGHPMNSFFLCKDIFHAKVGKASYRFSGEATIHSSYRFSNEATRHFFVISFIVQLCNRKMIMS